MVRPEVRQGKEMRLGQGADVRVGESRGSPLALWRRRQDPSAGRSSPGAHVSGQEAPGGSARTASPP